MAHGPLAGLLGPEGKWHLELNRCARRVLLLSQTHAFFPVGAPSPGGEEGMQQGSGIGLGHSRVRVPVVWNDDVEGHWSPRLGCVRGSL